MSVSDSVQIAPPKANDEPLEKNLNTRLSEQTYQRFKQARERLHCRSNEEALERLLEQEEKVQDAKKLVASLVVTQPVSLCKPLLECMYDLQKRIAKMGYKVPLSAAINLCILYFILNAPKYLMDREDGELLLRFIRHGPGVLNRDMPEIEKYFKTGIDFDNEEEDDSE